MVLEKLWSVDPPPYTQTDVEKMCGMVLANQRDSVQHVAAEVAVAVAVVVVVVAVVCFLVDPFQGGSNQAGNSLPLLTE